MLEWLGVDANALGLDARVESYEHLGDVRCFVRALDAAANAEALAAA